MTGRMYAWEVERGDTVFLDIDTDDFVVEWIAAYASPLGIVYSFSGQALSDGRTVSISGIRWSDRIEAKKGGGS